MKHFLWLLKELLKSIFTFDMAGIVECYWLLRLHLCHKHTKINTGMEVVKINKEQILEELTKIDVIGVARDKYMITYGAALVLQGVKLETRDIDIYCPNANIIKFLVVKGYEKLPFRSGEMVKVTEKVDFFTGCMSVDPMAELICGFQVQTVQSIYDEKAARGREKDLVDLPLIKKWLENN